MLTRRVSFLLWLLPAAVVLALLLVNCARAPYAPFSAAEHRLTTSASLWFDGDTSAGS